MSEIENLLVGRLIKVIQVEMANRLIFGRQLNGDHIWVTLVNGDLPGPGDVIIVANDDWGFAPAGFWPGSKTIAVVKELLDGDEVLIDDGLQLRIINNDRQVALTVRNTVELGDDGSIRVIADKPLRSRDQVNDADDARQEYLMPRSEKGLTFADFGGYPDVVSRARALIDTQLDRRAALRQMGARPVKGILFTGPPGTGKTHLARIIADQSNADFFLVSGPSVVSKWLGDSEDTLRRIFDAAAASAPNQAIIFFDEIDSIAERRTGESHEASKRLVAQLLTLMDGFDEKAGNIIVIASTNRVETLDPALTRPGRFDWEIEFGMPNLDDRLQILTVGASNLQTEGALPLHDLAAMTSGWSAAELSVLWVEAALIATGEDRTKICGEDVARAFERVAQRPRHDSRKFI
jgi:transitional endoplasmic reticulum ATPase